MSDHVTNLRWLGNQLDADAADKGIGQGSEGARICWNAAMEIESLRQKLTEKDQTILDHVEIQQALRQQLAAKQAKVDELREHVLCDKEPAAWLQISVDDPSLATLVRMKKPVKFDPSWWRFEPLYKAKEPEQ